MSAGIGHLVRLLGEVNDPDLPVLYAHALAFVYPSEYEGFGLQLCEAMATGYPVLAARATSLPEVLGDGGELFDLSRPTRLAAQLRAVACDASFRSNLSERGRRRALDFSWRRAAAETYRVYRSLTTATAGAPSPTSVNDQRTLT